MIENGPKFTPELSKDVLHAHAKRFQLQLDGVAKAVIDSGKNTTTREGSVHIGDQANFVTITGLGTETRRIVVGKTPDIADTSHPHISLASLLHLPGHERGTGENPDQNAFDAWEATVTTGENPKIVYAAHAWKTETSIDENGKKSTGKVMVSVSKGIQTNNEIAVEGIDNLLAFNSLSAETPHA